MFNTEYSKIKYSVQKKRNEILTFAVIGLLFISAIYYFTYIYYRPINSTDLPNVNIICEEDLDDNDYINCTFEIESSDESDTISPIQSRIKIRGFFNAKLPKKGYRIELSSQVSLLGMRKDDDWLLFAMFLDIPHMRVKLSLDLWRSLESSNPTAILPKSKYIALYINGQFQGVYLLAEKNDRRLFDLNNPQYNENSSLIFQAGSHRKNFLDYSSDDWEQDWPNIDDGYNIIDNILTNLTSFIRNSNDSEFFDSYKGIYSKFDKLNLIDFYLFNFFILHKDFWSQNYFIVRNDYPSLFYLIPWDFDASFGQYFNRKYSSKEDPTADIKSRNHLYERLLSNDDFKLVAKERWFLLRQTTWTEESILDEVSNLHKKVENVLEIDANMWYRLIFENDWEKEVEEAIDHLYAWIPERLAFCDSYFSNF